MNRSITLLLGVVGFALILALAVYHGSGKIERDLTQRGESVLSEKHLAWVRVEAKGRNLRLRGEAPSEQEAALAVQLMQALDGVNRVIDEFAMLSTTDAPTDKPTSGDPWSSNIKER
ncbi:BON domain-containing protein [Sedimenticola hydrogenitrophicus]|uniref:BON domain-containing protein n=1 Tax=Sedimenticola hydrogenitrophicus TaxID=2967975 RepID=UPI0021A2E9AA|nr:BON domain-containing protein [Sedimenticola hydrogenitrophicus]